jgi:Putative zinc-finger/FecR protein
MFRNHVSQELSAYLHDQLSPADAGRIADHLRDCRSCRKEYEEIKFGAQLSNLLSPAQPPASLWNELESLMNQAGEGNGRRPFGGQPLKLAAAWAAFVLIGVSAWWIYRTATKDPTTTPLTNVPSYAVTKIAGQPKIDNEQMGERGTLAIGQVLVTDDSSSAQISVAEIGEVKVDPNSSIRLLEARDEEHRLNLARGRMHAFIWAPPGQFYVVTSSANAVDLGCSYTLEINENGQGLLQVTSGWVAFEWKERESFVPADAMCVTRPVLGPGTPYFYDASEEFQTALDQFDKATPDDPLRAPTLDEILKRARKRDAFTLWHLLNRAEESERSRIYDRLARLVPPPATVTRDGIVNREKTMIDAWWDQLGLGNTDWWRMWKGPLPTKTK